MHDAVYLIICRTQSWPAVQPSAADPPLLTLSATPFACRLACSTSAVAGSGSKACTAATLAASCGSSSRRRQKRPMLAPAGTEGGSECKVCG